MKFKVSISMILSIVLTLSLFAYASAEIPQVYKDSQLFTADTTPPTLQSISVDKTNTISPAVLNYSLNIEDDISGVTTVNIIIKDIAGTFYAPLIAYADKNGIYKAKLDIVDKSKSSIYFVAMIEVKDQAGNKAIYQSSRETPVANAVKLSSEIESNVTKGNDETFDLEVNLSEPTLITQLRNVSDGSKIKIICTNRASIPGEVMDAIYKTNKTVTLSYGVTTFTVDGQDVFSPKSSEFSIKCTDAYSGNSGEILFLFDHAGKFPAPAHVLTGAEYLANDGLLENLYIYRLNSSMNVIEQIASGVSLTPDEKLPMSITYGGDYMVTAKKHEISGGSSGGSSENSPSTGSGGSSGSSGGSYSKSSSSNNNRTVLNPRKTTPAPLAMQKVTGANPDYGTLDIERGARDLVMLHMANLNLPENEYASYYYKNYETLFKKYYNQLTALSTN